MLTTQVQNVQAEFKTITSRKMSIDEYKRATTLVDSLGDEEANKLLSTAVRNVWAERLQPAEIQIFWDCTIKLLRKTKSDPDKMLEDLGRYFAINNLAKLSHEFLNLIELEFYQQRGKASLYAYYAKGEHWADVRRLFLAASADKKKYLTELYSLMHGRGVQGAMQLWLTDQITEEEARFVMKSIYEQKLRWDSDLQKLELSSESFQSLSRSELAELILPIRDTANAARILHELDAAIISSRQRMPQEEAITCFSLWLFKASMIKVNKEREEAALKIEVIGKNLVAFNSLSRVMAFRLANLSSAPGADKVKAALDDGRTKGSWGPPTELPSEREEKQKVDATIKKNGDDPLVTSFAAMETLISRSKAPDIVAYSGLQIPHTVLLGYLQPDNIDEATLLKNAVLLERLKPSSHAAIHRDLAAISVAEHTAKTVRKDTPAIVEVRRKVQKADYSEVGGPGGANSQDFVGGPGGPVPNQPPRASAPSHVTFNLLTTLAGAPGGPAFGANVDDTHAASSVENGESSRLPRPGRSSSEGCPVS